MKRLLLFLIFIFNCFSADVKDVVERKSLGELKEQQARLAKTSDEKTLLLLSSASETLEEGNLEKIAELLKKGTNPNIRDELTGDTPLIRATRMGNLQVIRLLKENGADVKISDNDNVNPLIEAVITENPEIVQAVLGFKGINEIINNKDISGFTALHHAVFHGNAKIVKLLLDFGIVDPFIKNNNGKSIRDLFYDRFHESLSPTLFSSENEYKIMLTISRYIERFNENSRLLIFAIREKNIPEILKILNNKFVNVNHEVNIEGYRESPLVAAIYSENKQIVELIVQHGADIFIIFNGFSILEIAIINLKHFSKRQNEILEIIKFLIERGGNNLIKLSIRWPYYLYNFSEYQVAEVFKLIFKYSDLETINEIAQVIINSPKSPERSFALKLIYQHDFEEFLNRKGPETD